ncbi:WYL domain-containing protein [Lachnospiraceae bacterium XBB2008]|nr:WYL domain-containing protein [Lachnospiraceae bacterium XBB2008]
MENENQLSNEQIDELLIQAKGGDNEAWTELYGQFKAYIHRKAWERIKGRDIQQPARLERELFQAGWIGFAQALKRYEPGKAGFLTYARQDIDHAISDQIKFEFGDGITEKPMGVRLRVERAAGTTEDEQRAFDAQVSHAMSRKAESGMTVAAPTEHDNFGQARRVLQMIEVLKKLTDEDHSLNKTDLLEQLHYYRVGKYGNDSTLKYRLNDDGEAVPELDSDDNTYTSDITEMLKELDPLKFNGANDDEYRIRYSGYKEDALYRKLNKEKGQKAPTISDFSYTHDFDNETLDKLIQMVSFSDMFTNEEKTKLIRKLVATASEYYRTPFMDGDNMKFNPSAIHGRFAHRNGGDRNQLTENLKTIQRAINSLSQITFKFNRYTADHRLVPKYDRVSILSPYHMVVYHDNYYVIGLNQAWGDKRVLHYRVDLMSDIEIARDEEGNDIPIEVCDFDGLPISNAYWDPEKYMSEHINMAYDDPREIRIKLRDSEYTLLHNWFGNHYEKVDSVTETNADGNEIRYDIVTVRTSPYMIVHWALQYGTSVEILDEEIRGKIREELKEMNVMYEKGLG